MINVYKESLIVELEGKNRLEHPRICGEQYKIDLEEIGHDSSHSRCRPVVGCCEHDTVSFGSMK
jgi:hypothetical protein